MKFTLTFMLITSMATGIYGCSSDNSGSAETRTSADKETVFQPQIDALKKAKQVEDIMQQHDQDTRQAIDKQ